MKNLYLAILSGGDGTRLWPLSRADNPKQFSSIVQKQNLSFLQATILRNDFVAKQNTPLLLTNEKLDFLTKNQISDIKKDCQIVLEPSKKDSFPACLIACLKLYQENKDAIVLITPADHIISDEIEYKNCILSAYQFLLKNPEFLLSFSIKPSSAHIGYGYIEQGERLADDIYQAKKFHEKPNQKTAEKYLKNDSFAWNSGIFMFKAEEFMKIAEKEDPETFLLCKKSLENANKSTFLKLEKESFDKIKANSVDYAILEKTKKLAAVKGNFVWNDIGSWQSIYDVAEKDKEANVVFGKNITLENSKNTVVFTQGKKQISLLDVQNIVVIDTEDAVLVANLETSQNVKKLVQRLKKEKKEIVEKSATGHRPWGYYKIIIEEKNYKSKQVVVYPYAQISVQYHNHRAEHWVIVRGEALVSIDGKEQKLLANQSVYIPKTVIHTIKNTGLENLVFIEVQTGDYLEEDDIVRLKDNYGRV